MWKDVKRHAHNLYLEVLWLHVQLWWLHVQMTCIQFCAHAYANWAKKRCCTSGSQYHNLPIGRNPCQYQCCEYLGGGFELGAYLQLDFQWCSVSYPDLICPWSQSGFPQCSRELPKASCLKILPEMGWVCDICDKTSWKSLWKLTVLGRYMMY